MDIKICSGKSCTSKFSKYILTRLERDTEFYKWKDVRIEESCCMGECKKGPNMKIDNETFNYVGPAKASQLISKKINEKRKQQENNSKSKKKK